MEASAIKYQAGLGLHGRSPLLRLQSDERLITLLRRGNTAAFEVLVSRYESRLLSFCRHLLGSREDAEDVLQEVMTAAFHAICADERPINVRPWLYRIARNRSLNHLRRTRAIGVDSMDHHLAEHGATTADKVGEREEFRLLVGDIQDLPETQRTALVLREMDALSYEQIAEAMETTVSSVKSLLVRARVSLAEAAEARLLTCEQVRTELGEVAEGLQKRPSPLVRRHLKGCTRCTTFRTQLKATNKALAALLPVGPLVVFRKLAFLHLGHSAGSTASATAAGGTASAGAGAALGASGALGGGSVISAGMGAVATKAAAGLAAAAIVTAGAVEVDHASAHHPAPPVASAAAHVVSPIAPAAAFKEPASTVRSSGRTSHGGGSGHGGSAGGGGGAGHATHHVVTRTTRTTGTTGTTVAASAGATTTAATAGTTSTATTGTTSTPTTTTDPGRVQTQTDPTVLPPTTTTAPAPPIGTPTTPATPVTTVTTTTTTSAPPTTTGTTVPGTTVTTGTTATTVPGTTTTGTPTTGTTTAGTTSTSTTPGVTTTSGTSLGGLLHRLGLDGARHFVR